MLCHFGQTRKGYVATYFIFLSSTAVSSATTGYIVVPGHFGQTEEPAGSNKERTRKKPSLVSKADLIDTIAFPKIYLWYSMIIFVYSTKNWWNFQYFPPMEKLFYLLFILLYIVSVREKNFDVHFRRIIPVHFPSKDGKDAVYKWRFRGKVVYFPPKSAYFFCFYKK